MANRLDEQALARFADDNRRPADAALEHAGLAVEPQLAVDLGFAVAFEAVLDENGANLRLEKGDFVSIVVTSQ